MQDWLGFFWRTGLTDRTHVFVCLCIRGDWLSELSGSEWDSPELCSVCLAAGGIFKFLSPWSWKLQNKRNQGCRAGQTEGLGALWRVWCEFLIVEETGVWWPQARQQNTHPLADFQRVFLPSLPSRLPCIGWCYPRLWWAFLSWFTGLGSTRAHLWRQPTGALRTVLYWSDRRFLLQPCQHMLSQLIVTLCCLRCYLSWKSYLKPYIALIVCQIKKGK